MRKADSLRAAIVAELPELAQDPQALKIWLDKGSVIARTAPGRLAWEYRYSISLLLLDFAGDQDRIFAAVIQWVAVEQPDLLMPPAGVENAIRFQADIVDDVRADVLVELEVSESVQVEQGVATHLTEPPLPEMESIDGQAVPPRLAIVDMALGV
jgi:hypothetical protein